MSINKNKLFLKSLAIFVLSLMFFSFPHCESKQQSRAAVSKGQYTDILGCWKGWPVGRFADRNEQLRFIALKPDGNPAITFIYELRQRSRVSECDIDVTYQDSVISWGGQAGQLSENKDTITVIEEWQGEKSTWNFTRHKEAENFITLPVKSLFFVQKKSQNTNLKFKINLKS